MGQELVITETDHGPLIRANATNRVPTTDELVRLCSRYAGELNFTLNP